MIDRRDPPTDGVLLIVSVDTEEDNWHRSRHDVTTENIQELRPLAAFLGRLGVRPTYFTAYQVAVEHGAADVLREVCDGGRGEIAAHLHPWNTPPLTEAFVPRNSMLKSRWVSCVQSAISWRTSSTARRSCAGSQRRWKRRSTPHPGRFAQVAMASAVTRWPRSCAAAIAWTAASARSSV